MGCRDPPGQKSFFRSFPSPKTVTPRTRLMGNPEPTTNSDFPQHQLKEVSLAHDMSGLGSARSVR